MDSTDVLDVADLREGLPPDARRPWTREAFDRAGDAGFFGPEERLELIGGEVIRKMTPQHSPHATAVCLIEDVLRALCPATHHVRVQFPLALGPHSEPEPDVCVVRGSVRDYARAHPTAAALVVEVADTTLGFDRGTKAGLYARAGVPEYWILNLVDRVLEMHREPRPSPEKPFGHAYGHVVTHVESATISSLVSPGREIGVRDLLP